MVDRRAKYNITVYVRKLTYQAWGTHVEKMVHFKMLLKRSFAFSITLLGTMKLTGRDVDRFIDRL